MSTYKERRLERKRYRRTRFGIWIGRIVAIIILVIALVFLFTTFRKVESLPQKELGRVEFVPAPGRPEPKPLQVLLDQRAEKEIAAFICKSNDRVDKELASEMAKTYIHAARLYDIDVKLLVAKDWTESRFDPFATSRDENGNPVARGVAQFTLGTGRAIWAELGFEWNGASSLYNPIESIIAGAHYLKQLIVRYHGNYTHALEAYNMGPTKLDELHEKGQPLRYTYAGSVKQTMGGI
jgi:soluble lytic murein transglycosylase-like protein